MNQAMPTFSGHRTVDQQAINNETFKGKPYLVNVWASWCSSCVMEHQRWMAYSKAKHIPLIGVVYNDEMTKAQNWLAQQGNPYDGLISDPKGRLVIDLGVYGTPETLLVDGSGIIRKRFIGPISQAWLDQIQEEYML
jgi:cytochrome c biogenesis protein CcmG/thiol:disulfide interchange protein DsbE